METVLQLIENMLLKIKQNSQKIFGAKIGVDPNVIWTQNFSGPKFFSGPKLFLGQKFFWGSKLFSNKILFQTQIFFFQTQNFF